MASPAKKFTLKSSDGETFEVEEDVALLSKTIKDMIENGAADNDIIHLNVTGKILSKVIKFCKKRAGVEEDEENSPFVDTKTWDEEFVKVDQHTLYDLVMAAIDLNIYSLLKVTYKSFDRITTGMSMHDISKTFNMKNDDSASEEEEEDTDASNSEVEKED